MDSKQKLLLGAVGAGIAGFMLWRFWPKAELQVPIYQPSSLPSRQRTFNPNVSTFNQMNYEEPF